MKPEREKSAIESLRRRTVESIRATWPGRNHPAAEGRARAFLRTKIDELRALAEIDRLRTMVLRAERERGNLADELAMLEEDVEEHLPACVVDAEGGPGNARERIEYAGKEIARLTRERDEARAEHQRHERALHLSNETLVLVIDERDEARAQLAALREAGQAALLAVALREALGDDPGPACRALDAALADTEAAAREYEARIRAKALREAADEIHAQAPFVRASTSGFEAWLRKKADKAERGA